MPPADRGREQIRHPLDLPEAFCFQTVCVFYYGGRQSPRSCVFGRCVHIATLLTAMAEQNTHLAQLKPTRAFALWVGGLTGFPPPCCWRLAQTRTVDFKAVCDFDFTTLGCLVSLTSGLEFESFSSKLPQRPNWVDSVQNSLFFKLVFSPQVNQ